MTDVPPERPVHLLATDAAQASVLVEALPTGDLGLPAPGGIRDLDGHPPIAALVERYFGRPVPATRVLPVGADMDRRPTDIAVVVEPIPASDLIPGRWLPVDDRRLDALGLETPVAAVVGRWLEELRTGEVDPRRQRWEWPGFQERARRWMRDRLEAAGTPALGEPTVQSLWAISAVMRADVTDGRAFLKACAHVFADEPAIAAALDRRVPGAVPAVVATDPGEGWLLMRDAGGAALGEAPEGTWDAGLVALGAIQRTCEDTLDGVRLEDRGPLALASTLPGLLDGPFVAAFPGDLRDRLVAALPRFHDACMRLVELGPGPSIVHGDFHPWNVHRDGDRVVVIDWSDTALGHPFQDLATYLDRTKDPEARRSMLDAYLDGWAGAATRADLEEAAQLALPVGALHQVESYRRIIESLEPGPDWGLGGGGAWFARWALAWLADGLDAIVER